MNLPPLPLPGLCGVYDEEDLLAYGHLCVKTVCGIIASPLERLVRRHDYEERKETK